MFVYYIFKYLILSKLLLKILFLSPIQQKLSVVEVNWAKCLLLSSLTFIQKKYQIFNHRKKHFIFTTDVDIRMF